MVRARALRAPKVVGVLAMANLVVLSGCGGGSSSSPPTASSAPTPVPSSSMKAGIPSKFSLAEDSSIAVEEQTPINIISGTLTITLVKKGGPLAALIEVVGKATTSGTKADFALTLTTDKTGAATSGMLDSNVGPTPKSWTVVPSGRINLLNTTTGITLLTEAPIVLTQGTKASKTQMDLKLFGTRVAPSPTSTSKSPSPYSTSRTPSPYSTR